MKSSVKLETLQINMLKWGGGAYYVIRKIGFVRLP
jgi:hypothetical protein